LRQHLRQHLPDYMIPQHIVEVPAIPLTPNGKVDRRALPDPLGRGPAEEDDHVAPRTAMERLVAEIWREVLAVERVSVHENFFDAGGHSLLSIRALYLMRERTGQRLDPRVMLFDNLTQIAARLDTMEVRRTDRPDLDMANAPR